WWPGRRWWWWWWRRCWWRRWRRWGWCRRRSRWRRCWWRRCWWRRRRLRPRWRWRCRWRRGRCRRRGQDFDLDPAGTHRVAGAEPGRTRYGRAVDGRAVAATQVDDAQGLPGRPQAQVTTGDLGVGDDDGHALTADLHVATYFEPA